MVGLLSRIISFLKTQIFSAVFIFSAILKPIRVFLNTLGIRNCFYIDDLLVLGSSRLEVIENDLVAKQTLRKAGWVVSDSKTLGPSQRLKYLGLEIDSVHMKFFIPVAKLEKIKSKIDDLLKSGSKVWVRKLASVVGLLQSCARALGPIVRFRTRSSYAAISSAVQSHGWDGFLFLSKECLEELTFWSLELEHLNGFPFSLSRSEVTMVSDVDIVSDASNIGKDFDHLLCFKFSNFQDLWCLSVGRTTRCWPENSFL